MGKRTRRRQREAMQRKLPNESAIAFRVRRRATKRKDIEKNG